MGCSSGASAVHQPLGVRRGEQAVDDGEPVVVDDHAGVGVSVLGAVRDPRSGAVAQVHQARIGIRGHRRTLSTLYDPGVPIPEPQMSVDELNEFLSNAFDAERPYRVESVLHGRVVLTLDADGAWLRPGNTVAGPVFMMLADAAAYAAVLADIGRVGLAVTSNLDINFLRKTERSQVTATAELLKLGRRLAIVDVRMTSATEPDLVAQATVTYAIPSPA